MGISRPGRGRARVAFAGPTEPDNISSGVPIWLRLAGPAPEWAAIPALSAGDTFGPLWPEGNRQRNTPGRSGVRRAEPERYPRRPCSPEPGTGSGKDI